MLDILAKIFGPARAVSLYVLIKRFGIPTVLLIGFACILAFTFLTASKDRYEHVAYVEATVLETAPLTTANTSPGVFVDVLLADGTELKLTETEGAIARTLTDRACLEQRRDTESGGMDYRLRMPHRCGF